MKQKQQHQKSDANILNEIERKVRKGTATGREMRLLVESYFAFNIPIPDDIVGKLEVL